MTSIAGDQVVAELMADDHALERHLLGTSDAREVTSVIADFCRRALGADPVRYEFYVVSVGAVHGLLLADGRRVVLKLHRREVTEAYLRGLQELQRHAARRGMPAPQPLVPPAHLRNALITAETMIDRGRPPDPYEPAERELMASGLARFVAACRDFPERSRLRSWFEPAAGAIWPTPHDIRFDFAGTAVGAEWIDTIGACALERIRRGLGESVVGHNDWRREHLRIDAGDLCAIYDWDSVTVALEPTIVAGAMRTFPADWTARSDHRQYPTLSEMRAFLAAYERERGRRFGDDELTTVDAAIAYGAAYSARCEHSDLCTDLGRMPARPSPPRAAPGTMSAFLLAHAEELLPGGAFEAPRGLLR